MKSLNNYNIILIVIKKFEIIFKFFIFVLTHLVLNTHFTRLSIQLAILIALLPKFCFIT